MRRLALIALLLLAGASSAHVFPFPGRPGTYGGGGGSDITASLVASKTTGTAPLHVFFESIATTHADSDVKPYSDLLYEWTFDDSADTFATNGKSRNSALGPMAVHVFETAGTYTVRVTVTDESGDTDFAESTITVSALTDTYDAATEIHCFSNDTTHTGCPALATEHDSITDFDLALDTHCGIDAVNASGACLFQGGDSFDVDTSTVIQAGDHHIGTIGSGRAIINGRSAGDITIFGGSASAIFENLTLYGLDIRGNQNDGNPAHAVVTCTSGADDFDYVLLHDNLIDGFGHSISCGQGTSPDEVPDLISLSENTITDPGNRSIGYLEATRQSQIGNSAANNAGTGSGHMRIKYFYKWIAQHNRYTGISQNQVYRLNGEAPSSTTSAQVPNLTDSWYYLLADNYATNEEDGDLGIGFIGGAINATGGLRHSIIERNEFVMESNATGRVIENCFQDITIRNNITRQNSVSSNAVYQMFHASCGGGSRDGVRIYNNTSYGTGSNPRVMVSLNSTNTNSIVRNNLYYTPGDTGTSRIVSGTAGTGSVASNNTQFDDVNKLVGNTANGGDGLFDEVADLQLDSTADLVDGGFDFFASDEDGEALFVDFAGTARIAGAIDPGAYVSE